MTRWRILSLCLAGVLIAALTVYRATRPVRPAPAIAETQKGYPPRGWELPYKFGAAGTTGLMKFDRYLGRQPLVVVFTGSHAAPESDPALAWLRNHYDLVQSAGYEAIGVTAALPGRVQSGAEAHGGAWPFPVVSDIELRNPAPTPVHRLWGLQVDSAAGSEGAPTAVKGGVFLVDRMGYVEYERGAPRAIESPLPRFAELFGKR